MTHEIRLELSGYRLDREKELRDALDLVCPGITEGWLTYNLHGGATASATLAFRTNHAAPRELAARLVAAALAADQGVKAFVAAVLPETDLVERAS